MAMNCRKTRNEWMSGVGHKVTKKWNCYTSLTDDFTRGNHLILSSDTRSVWRRHFITHSSMLTYGTTE